MSKRNKSIVLGIAIINVLMHLAFAGNLEYHRDELLYFSLGDHLSTGYYSVPPIIGWIAFVMKSIFGTSVFAVRLFPALLSGVLVYLTALITKELGGKTFALLISSLGILLMPVTLRAFHLFQPVPIDLFFWTLIFYLSIRYFKEKSNRILLILGVVVGISVLNKYLVVLLIISLILSFLLTQKRSIFKNRVLYLSLVIALIIFIPNFIWQFKHGFPVINHMAELNETQLVNVSRGNFLLDQLFMSFSFSIFIICGLYYFIRNEKYRYIGVTSILVLGILLLLRGKSYYSIGLFPVLLAGGSVFFENHIRNRVLKAVILILPVLLMIPIFPIGIPVFKQEGLVSYFKTLEDKYGLTLGRNFEDGSVHSLPQDYADQLGWEELVRIIAVTYDEIPKKDKALIYTENYGQAGAIKIIGQKFDLPDPVSFDESFIYWAPERFVPDIEYFIYVNDELGDDVAALFETIVKTGEITNINAREFGTSIFLCSNPRSNFNEFWKLVKSQQ